MDRELQIPSFGFVFQRGVDCREWSGEFEDFSWRLMTSSVFPYGKDLDLLVYLSSNASRDWSQFSARQLLADLGMGGRQGDYKRLSESFDRLHALRMKMEGPSKSYSWSPFSVLEFDRTPQGFYQVRTSTSFLSQVDTEGTFNVDIYLSLGSDFLLKVMYLVVEGLRGGSCDSLTIRETVDNWAALFCTPLQQNRYSELRYRLAPRLAKLVSIGILDNYVFAEDNTLSVTISPNRTYSRAIHYAPILRRFTENPESLHISGSVPRKDVVWLYSHMLDKFGLEGIDIRIAAVLSDMTTYVEILKAGGRWDGSHFFYTSKAAAWKILAENEKSSLPGAFPSREDFAKQMKLWLKSPSAPSDEDIAEAYSHIPHAPGLTILDGSYSWDELTPNVLKGLNLSLRSLGYADEIPTIFLEE